MTKNEKEVKKKEQLNLDGIKTGMVIKDLHDENVNVDDDLIEQMRRFEQETKMHSIWRGKVTGMFLRFKYIENHPEFAEEEKIKKVIEEELEEVVKKQVKDEENELLDAIEDYRMKFNVKTVNTNTKKFKAFFEEWKQEN